MPLNPKDFSEVVLVRILWAGAKQVLDDLGDKLENLVDDIWAGFPNPLAMVNAVLKFSTGVPGMILTLPISGLKRIFLDLLAKHKAGARLIRLDDAIAAYFDMQIALVQTITLTGEETLLTAFLGWLGRFTYRTFKRIKLLWLLSRAKTEAEFVQVFINSFKSKGRLLRMVAIALLAFLVFAVLGVFWSFFSLAFFGSKMLPKILPQDSKRVWIHGHQHRQNERTGKDKL